MTRTTLCLCILMFIAVTAINTPVRADTIYAGLQYSISGKNTEGLCHLINKKPCGLAGNALSSAKALQDILDGKADLAGVSSEDVHENTKVKVLLNLTSDGKTVLVSREDFPEQDGYEVISALHDFLSDTRERKYKRLVLEFMKLAPVYGGADVLERYLIFEKSYPLHSGMVKYFLSKLETPLKITYGIHECDRETKRCTSISDIPVENYKASKKIADMGKGIIPFLEEAVKNNNDFLVMKAAHAMGRIWPYEPEILTPSLLPLLNHPNDEVKEQAIYALSAQKPIQQVAVDKLIEIAQKEPIPRESFSDGSHGLSQRTTVLSQNSISQQAAYALTNAWSDDVFNVLKGLVKSQSLAKQAVGINALNQFIARENSKISQGLNHKERKNITLQDYSKEAQEIVAFLENEQAVLPDESKKLVMRVLGRYQPMSISKESILAAAKDLKDKEKKCHKQGEQKICEIPKIRDALYKLISAGDAAAIPEVFEGLEFVLQYGEANEKSTAYRLLEGLVSDHILPDTLINVMLHSKGTKQYKILATTAVNTPKWKDEIITFLTKKLSSNERTVRTEAIAALGLIEKNSVEPHYNISKLIIETIKNEQDGAVLQYMMEGLGFAASRDPNALNLLLSYTSFGKEKIDQAYEEIGKYDPDFKTSFSFGKQIFVPIDKLRIGDLYNIQQKAYDAISDMEEIPAAALKIIKNNYLTERARENCYHDMWRESALNVGLSAYKKHGGSVKEIAPAIINILSREDPECQKRMIVNLPSIREEANAALPIIEKLLDKNDIRKNNGVFHALKDIDTPEVEAFIQKHARLNPSQHRKKNKIIYDLLHSLNSFYFIEPTIKNAEVHVIAVERTGVKPAKVTVDVNYPDSPIVLLLFGKDQIAWTVNPTKDTNIAALRLGGRELQIAETIPDDIPYTGYVGIQSDYSAAGGIDGEYSNTTLRVIEPWTGHRPTTFQYYRVSDHVVLDKKTHPMPPFSSGTHLSKVFDEDGKLKTEYKKRESNMGFLPMPE